MMMAQPQTTDSSGVDHFKQTIIEVVNTLLDNFYEANPQSKAFGSSYDVRDEEDSSILVGRENGADGAESDCGFDYFYRRFRPLEDGRVASQEYHYIYGEYGWSNSVALSDNAPVIRQLFEEAVESDYLTGADLERFDASVEEMEQKLVEWRESFDLEAVAELFIDRDEETLRDLLVTSDEDGRVVWSLLNSKDADGNVVENESLEIPVVSEEDALMLVRAVRTYVERDGTVKEQPYGAVVGYDDTPERFFIHRLRSDTDLRDEETVWTPELVKEKMGFDAHWWEVDLDDLPFETVIRMQGDLALVRHEYGAELEAFTTEQLRSEKTRRVGDYNDRVREECSDLIEHEDVSISERTGAVRVYADDTDSLKALQDDVAIAEERVRELQDNRGISRLTWQRRQEIVEDIILDRAFQATFVDDEVDAGEFVEQAKQQIRQRFDQTNRQVNAVLGNHTVALGSVQEHPNRFWGDSGTQAAYIAPEGQDALAHILHDEHQDQQVVLEPGVYEFRFLNGFEDQFWMANT